VVAKNTGGTTVGPLWSFKTAGTPPPAAPASPNPADGTLGTGTALNFGWSAPGATSYAVRLGTVNPPPTVVSDSSQSYYYVPALITGTTYYWQVVAKNSDGATVGPLWSFKTAGTPPPVGPAAPTSPNPANGTLGTGTSLNLSWSAPGATSYDVRVGTVNPPPIA